MVFLFVLHVVFTRVVSQAWRDSQASAVGGDEEGHGHDSHEHHHNDKELTLLVGEWLCRTSHVGRGTGADLSIAAEANHVAPDEPSEGSERDKSVQDSNQDSQSFVLRKLVDDLNSTDDSGAESNIEPKHDEALEGRGHVLTLTIGVWLSKVGGEALPGWVLVCRRMCRCIVIEVIGEEGTHSRFEDEPGPGHLLSK